MKNVTIELQGVCKSYYSESTVTQALRKIDLSFESGEFVAITGESGSGKSSLLYIIGGLNQFDDGEMFVDGEPTFPYDEADWEEYRRSRIGYVFQDYNLIGHYSAKDNIVSALLIMGKPVEEAEEAAFLYLRKVGLEVFAGRRASELSSGQKQRLSIARALAKDTPVLIADEPTGNLDSETGRQIIALLKELSRDRLVIMVTHNINQAEGYVTRKIRLHDGSVVSDVRMNGENTGTEAGSETAAAETQTVHGEQTVSDAGNERGKTETAKGLSSFSLAGFFAGLNIRTRIGRDVLFIIFMFLIAAVSFVLIGELWMHRDGTLTKNYSDAAFARRDTTRIVAVNADGSAFSEDKIEAVRSISSVVAADPCDYCNDINFYMTEGVDYEITYSRRGWFGGRVATLNFLNNSRFMLSSECIDESALAAGRLPAARNEIVLYGDETLINKKYTTYFTAKNLWGSGEYCNTELVVVGILKEETANVYFSTELAQILGMNMDSDLYRLYYAYNNRSHDYSMKPKVALIVNLELKGNDVIVSDKLSTLPGIGKVLFCSWEKDDDGNVTGNPSEDEVNVTSYTDRFTSIFMEVSPEFFEKYYQPQVKQMSVYITSYAKTDSVIKKLENMGCHAVSTYRVGASEYLPAKVKERVTIVGICSFGLIVIMFVAVMILRALMRLNLKDYRLLDFIGARLSVLKGISVIEMCIFCLISVILAVAAAFAARAAGVSAAAEIIEYMTPVSVLLFVLFNFAITGLAVFGFNRLLKRRLA